MPKRPTVNILSPTDPRFQKKEDPSECVPMPIVMGLVRGLLNHCWSPKRRPTKEGRIDQVHLEDMIMDGVEVAVKNSGTHLENVPQLYAGLKKPDDPDDQQEWLVKYFASQMPFIFQSLTGHDPFILKADHDLLVDFAATHYPPPENTEGSRKQWLREQLPLAFQLLKDTTKCSNSACLERQTLRVDDVTLDHMALDITTPGELVFEILGHFHGIHPDRVKRQVYTRHAPS